MGLGKNNGKMFRKLSLFDKIAEDWMQQDLKLHAKGRIIYGVSSLGHHTDMEKPNVPISKKGIALLDAMHLVTVKLMLFTCKGVQTYQNHIID